MLVINFLYFLEHNFLTSTLLKERKKSGMIVMAILVWPAKTIMHIL